MFRKCVKKKKNIGVIQDDIQGRDTWNKMKEYYFFISGSEKKYFLKILQNE